MHWKKGTSRVVLVVPKLGICLKFARVQVMTALTSTFRLMWTDRHGFSPHLVRWYWSHPASVRLGGGRAAVFRGMLDNVREWRYSRLLAHPVLARTYLSIGFVNVQEAVLENPHSLTVHTRQLEDIVGWRTINDSGDLHAFSSKNFGVRDGKAVVVDYASLAMQRLLDAYADQIHAQLDLVSPP
ncbi:hypothetical protein A2348_04600 [Candidatus Uhrbacteria bacterium RIFOXYB12_FULL_58_10]|uniref:Uncharacterized protein n=1 Tax=Candidatus Uhrbacteria bacterium RIFOXYB2_FULL_57_15 TaxID=1802422 RepID=A0A1F7W674_9BACT|nr:MAG: hypothetical protein A2348_04600 [Candidatus Uhrbacteria bacterium RIFOXYB12_FULL_58_10]OGL98269.1 MAG: hypothetical protein A2304_00260 [Candidatus Uhrbacteria bacterium RIFOXYB2_FULL_57_15]OGL98957.1 MAG: hypothetical protein A2501_02410 [Candidatus Uhrbacteria bacterium RIFOXYC12_FULL_57_11]